jgi:hypothetical protein
MLFPENYGNLIAVPKPARRKRTTRLVGWSWNRTLFKITPPVARSGPTLGGDERSDDVANQNAGKEDAYQQSLCRQFHGLDSC